MKMHESNVGFENKNPLFDDFTVIMVYSEGPVWCLFLH